MAFSPDELELIKAVNGRTCAVFTPGGFRPTGNPLATKFGGIPVGLADEAWPMHQKQFYDGAERRPGEWVPSSAICQINLTEAPFVPEPLSQFAMLTLFCATTPPDRHGYGGGPEPFEEYVTIRAYTSLDGLVPLIVPDAVDLNWIKEMECQWQEKTDWPIWSGDDAWLPDGVEVLGLEEDAEEQLMALENAYVSKLGGHHSYSQNPAFDSEEPMIIQIAEEPKIGLHWINGGTLAIGLTFDADKQPQWRADIQFY
ncbi:MAG: DUF1963 domain-containing protein [Pseudomonadota bacterium]